jgi:hypothetical protein
LRSRLLPYGRAARSASQATAALGFLELEPRAPELQLLHRWLDTWTGGGLIAVGVERLGYRLSLSHIAEGSGGRSSWGTR